MTEDTSNKLRDSLAANIHDAWARWTTHLLKQCSVNEDGSLTIPPESVQRWKRQIATDYENLSTDEKASDLREADLILKILATTQKGQPDASFL